MPHLSSRDEPACGEGRNSIPTANRLTSPTTLLDKTQPAAVSPSFRVKIQEHPQLSPKTFRPKIAIEEQLRSRPEVLQPIFPDLS